MGHLYIERHHCIDVLYIVGTVSIPLPVSCLPHAFFGLGGFLFDDMVKSNTMELRSNTRKNYAKLANVNSDSDDEDHVQEPGLSGFIQNKNNNHDGGEIINTEFFPSEGESSDPDCDGAESSDEDIKNARRELEELKKKQRETAKKSKLEKIAEEKRAVRKSLEKAGDNKKIKRRSGQQVTVASLRKMDDVVEQVDKLMDRNLKLKCTEQYSDSDLDSEPTREFSGVRRRSSRGIVEEEKDSLAGNHCSGKVSPSHLMYCTLRSGLILT